MTKPKKHPSKDAEPTNWWPPPSKKELNENLNNFGNAKKRGGRPRIRMRDLFSTPSGPPNKKSRIAGEPTGTSSQYKGIAVHEGKCWHVWVGRLWGMKTPLYPDGKVVTVAFCFRKDENGKPEYMFRSGIKAERLMPRLDLKRR